MIEITVQNINDKNILAFKYKQEVLWGSISEDDKGLITLLPEKEIKNLMNLCMKVLRDIKLQKTAEELGDKPIKFFGVNY